MELPLSEQLDVLQLQAPEPDQQALSFARNDAVQISQWVASLPLANTAETASMLGVATAELVRLDVAAPEKFEFIEALRPTVHYICARLDRGSFASRGQPLGGTSAQTLLTNLCAGYATLINALLKEVTEKQAPGLLAPCMHRFLSDSSRTMLRGLQLHLEPAQNYWAELGKVMRLAELAELEGNRIADAENHADTNITIKDAFLRSLLLSTCKPNQLQHQALALVFSALEQWAPKVELDKNTQESLLLFDMQGDYPPTFEAHMRGSGELRALRTEVLAYEIEAFLRQIESSVDIPDNLPMPLLEHLVEAWSTISPRAFSRLPAEGSVRVCVGLRAAHYFLSGGVEFSDQLSGTDELLRREVNPFLDVQFEGNASTEDGPWGPALIPENPNIDDPNRILLKKSAERGLAEPPPFDHHETIAVDTSPGGYCLRWAEQMPGSMKVGELVGLREERDARWCVAVVRWIRHDGKGALMGLQLLSPRAIPVALRAIQKRGGPTDFARALLLPELKSIGQPATLLTPRVPFEPNQKVHIQRQGIQTTGQLLEIPLSAESFNQFTFRMLDGYLENARSGSKMASLSEMTREDPPRAT